ncbi:type II toxin-antitoxin system VapB family antitoxin [Solirhodobacter olei]|uniref:type II toxin-antitoxin system VapB family antitoxin n=1 Tax=Solirhodobacter olei TaxID=2493082 RepID=UPI000FD99109|nr:type II toxin-antitoxin system VapB family antitoxin [Solirhodobacter olei]
MALYIKNEDVAALAARVAQDLHVDKTEAVRRALLLQLEALSARESLPEKIARLQAQVKADGFRRLPDEKAFMDELSGGI